MQSSGSELIVVLTRVFQLTESPSPHHRLRHRIERFVLARVCRILWGWGGYCPMKVPNQGTTIGLLPEKKKFLISSDPAAENSAIF